jgi:drug/metabolite transporter (DMT)-like permease
MFALGNIWIFYAISAAVLWGLSYTLTEQLMKKISVAGVIVTCALGSLLFGLALGFAQKTHGRDWQVLKQAGGEAKLALACITVYVTANVFILLSVKAKNATMAGMIEITYPLFTALFAWVLFREAQMGTGTALGGALIIAGVACIYFLDKTV